MNKVVFLHKRQTGKTSNAIFEAIKDIENTLIVTHNQMSAKRIKNKYPNLNLLVTYAYDMINFLTGRDKPFTIILDDYNLYNNNMEIYKYVENLKLLRPSMLKQLIIFSDLDIYIETCKTMSDAIEHVIKSKKFSESLEECFNTYLSKTISKIGSVDNVIDNYYSFLTDPDIKMFKYENDIYSQI